MEPELKQTVLDVCEAAKKLGIKIVLVGGLFAEFTGEIGPQDPPFPKTNDADFAVYVPDWETFGKLKAELVRRGFTELLKNEHRLIRGKAIVDLLPYGSQIAPNGKFVWPKSGMEFVVTGFDEVCASAQLSARPDAPSLPVATITGFVLLKIIAYLDRKEQGDQKFKGDAAHIDYCLKNFASGEGDMRRYDLSAAAGPDAQDYETAGAVLLGMGVRKLASPAAGNYVERFIRESEGNESSYVDAVLLGKYDDLEKLRAETARLVAGFKKGYRLSSNR